MNSARYGLARERQQGVYVNIALCHAQGRLGGMAMSAKPLVVVAWRREDAGAGQATIRRKDLIFVNGSRRMRDREATRPAWLAAVANGADAIAANVWLFTEKTQSSCEIALALPGGTKVSEFRALHCRAVTRHETRSQTGAAERPSLSLPRASAVRRREPRNVKIELPHHRGKAWTGAHCIEAQ